MVRYSVSQDTALWVCILLGAVVIFGFLVGSVFVYIRKDCWPIKQRNPMFALAVNLMCVIMSTMMMARGIFRWEGEEIVCVMQAMMWNSTAWMISILYSIRVTILVFKYEILEDVSKLSSAFKGLPLKDIEQHFGWFTRHRWVINPRWLLTFFSIDTACMVIYLIITVAVDPRYSTTKRCIRYFDLASTWSIFYSIVIATLHCIFIVILSSRIRHRAHDGFHIKAELTWTLSLFGLVYLLYIISSIVFGRKLIEHFLIGETVAHFGNYFFLIFGTIIPVYQSYYPPAILPVMAGSKEVDPGELEFDSVIRDTAGFESFLAFLGTEFATENLLFWQQVQQYERLVETTPPYQSAVTLATEIMERFLFDNAPAEINVSSFTRQKQRQLYVSFSTFVEGKASDPVDQEVYVDFTRGRQKESYSIVKLFEPAVVEVIQLMRTDSFRRYQTSRFAKDYARYLTEQKKAEVNDSISAILGDEKHSSKPPTQLGVRDSRVGQHTRTESRSQNHTTSPTPLIPPREFPQEESKDSDSEGADPAALSSSSSVPRASGPTDSPVVRAALATVLSSSTSQFGSLSSGGSPGSRPASRQGSRQGSRRGSREEERGGERVEDLGRFAIEMSDLERARSQGLGSI